MINESQLTSQEINMILQLLNRVQIAGSEAEAVVSLKQKLVKLGISIQKPPAKEVYSNDTDGLPASKDIDFDAK